MRYLSLYLPRFATDRAARRRSGTDEGGAGPLATVASLKGARRLVALDARAAALGLKPGSTLADARAAHPGLLVCEADPAGDAAALAALVDWCRLFTPLAAVDGADGAMLDVSGAAHLFGGEAALMAGIVRRLDARGLAAQAAVAGTPAAAWALARFGGAGRVLPDNLALHAKVFAPLPLAALRLDADALRRLAQAGLRRVGDLLMRPRAPIAARFGPEPHRRLDALLGLAREPIVPRFPAPAFVAERRFAEGIVRLEEVEATILALAYDLCGLLARHGEGARALHVSLFRVDGVVRHLHAGTGRPLRDPLGMARLFRERIAAAGEDGLDTGYGFEVVRLAATAAERLDPAQADLEGMPPDAGLDDLVDRLGARFGLANVLRLQLADAHQPARATVAVAAATANRAGIRRAAVIAAEDGDALPERPIRLLERPEPIEATAAVPDGPPLHFRWRRVLHRVAAVEGPERIGPDWWRRGTGRGAPDHTRDYYRAEDTDGRRFWLYREGLYREVAEPRWFLHGFFA